MTERLRRILQVALGTALILATLRLHSAGSVGFTTGYSLITHGTALLPVAALGFANGYGAYALVSGMLAVTVHANVATRIGVLRWVIANPEFHHWHHANERAAIDRNFSAALPLVDLVMGTAYLPRGRRPSRYGIDEPVAESYAGQLLHPFRRRGAAEPRAMRVAA